MNSNSPGILLLTVLCLIACCSAKAYGSTPNFTTLQPGQFREITQNLRINIVFVGFQRGTGPQDINEAELKSILTPYYRTYNLSKHEWLGNRYNYDYHVVYANTAFENSFFTFLSANSNPYGTVSPYQDFYNHETSRSLTIPEDHFIDATLTEKWLGEHSASIGVDTTQYTIFFINWYGKPGFRFHTYINYLHPDPDPDTGFDPNAASWLSDQISWGGTTADDEQNGLGTVKRIWFYDLSAGPDGRTYNYVLDTADVNGDGSFDYRIPPIWEYGNMSAYRPFDNLSFDLGLVTRVVVLDCLFTTMPVENPELANPLPTSIQDDLNYYDGEPPATGRSLTTMPRLKKEWSKLRPDNSFTVKQRDLSYSGEARDIYLCSLQSYHSDVATNCYPDSMPGFLYDLNHYNFDHYNDYFAGNPDYQAVTFTYTVPESETPRGPLGFSFINLMPGSTRNGFTYTWLPTIERQYDGNTNLVMHEVGHHLGLDHPHDGIDFWTGSWLFASIDPLLWLGDESDTTMSYSFLSKNYSQFDRDNMDRWMTAIYINHANTLLAAIISNDTYNRFEPQLRQADDDAARSLAAYQQMDYRSAVSLAKRSYDSVLRIAQLLGARVDPLVHATSKSAVGTAEIQKGHIAADLNSKGIEIKRLAADAAADQFNEAITESDDFNSAKFIADPFVKLRKSNSTNPILFSTHPMGGNKHDRR